MTDNHIAIATENHMKKVTRQIGLAALIRGCKKYLLTPLALAAMVGGAAAATVTVTVVDNGVSNIGATGTFYWALTNCHPGDTIAFNLSGPGPFYLQEPPEGFPIIHKLGNLLIDGYTQPGASPNTGSVTQANNAVIKIVIDGRNGNDRDVFTPDYTTNNTVPPIDNQSAGDMPGTGFSPQFRNGFGHFMGDLNVGVIKDRHQPLLENGIQYLHAGKTSHI